MCNNAQRQNILHKEMAAAGLFGIHVGNNFACIALSKEDGRLEVLANDTGDRLTPVTVQWTPEQCLVGRSAVLEQSRYYNNTINRTKQLLNDEITTEELQSLREQVPYRILGEGANFKYELVLNGKQQAVSVKEIARAVFKKLHAIGTMSVGAGTELQAVLTVPSYFSLKSISTFREIAEKAGFSVLQVIDEASAAILATVPPEKQGTCLVLRVGGVSTDATVLSIQDGLYSIISSVHKYGCGGRYITEKLREFLASEFSRQYKSQEITERGNFKLAAAAETAKQILSIQNVAQCSAESVGGGMDLNCSVSRPRLDNIVGGLVPQIMEAIREGLKQATITTEQVDMVVLCGGTAKIPRIQEVIKSTLSKAEMYGCGAVNPDEIIAMGAAMNARYATKSSVTVPNTLSMELPTVASQVTIQIKGGLTTEEVTLDTVLPVSRSVDATPGDVINVALHSNPDDNTSFVAKGPFDLNIDKDGKITLELANLSLNSKS